VLYTRQVPDQPITDTEVTTWVQKFAWMGPEIARRSLTHARLVIEGKARLISGGTLQSGAPMPFALDGVLYPTLRVFYESLKIPEGQLRMRFLAGEKRGALGVGRGSADRAFTYAGETIAVGSPAHLQLIARAVSAKVAAHDGVRRELAASGDARLYMGHAASQPLGRVMPFALMIERLARR